MKQARWTLLLMLIALAAVGLPAFAQGAPEGDEEESAEGGFIVELGTWIAQPAGLEFEPVTVKSSTDPFGTHPISMSDGTDAELYYKLGYQMGKNYGKMMAWIYDFDQDELASQGSTPGVFQFGETLVNPMFAGVGLNGLADAYDATAAVKLSDFRIDYSRPAFDNSRLKGEWFVGWRRVKFDRSIGANYYALVPGFPPLLPPLAPPNDALNPQADRAAISSRFEGRGLSAGMNFQIPLLRDRLRLDAGFSISALRGDMSSEYNSTTWYYVVESTSGDILLAPPYSEFGLTYAPNMGETAPLANLIRQRRLRSGLTVDGRSTSASIMEANLELRYRAWRGLEVVLGFRQTRYDDVALDLRTTSDQVVTGTISHTFATPSGTPLTLTSVRYVLNEEIVEQKRSVTFEGFYLGLGYSF